MRTRLRASIRVSKMRAVSCWQDEARLKAFCAEQLLRGRLALVLGAGVSMGCGLPDWSRLTRSAFAEKRTPFPTKLDNTQAAERLLVQVCREDELEFANTVRRALYKDFVRSALALTKKELLCAIGALAMASIRGTVTRIISFNFDDLLEVYLRYLGFAVQSVGHLPCWQSRADVRIYHPHGLLPSDLNEPVARGIVMAMIHYDRVMGSSKDSWRNLMLDALRSHTCLFIGLSGDDEHLRGLLAEAASLHVSDEQKDAFWGIRFSDNAKDTRRDIWETRRVFQQTLPSYEALPAWLFEVCQIAAVRSPFAVTI